MGETTEGREYEEIFRHSAVSLWVEDISQLRQELNRLSFSGVSDVPGFLSGHPDYVRKAVELIHVVDVNGATLDLYRVKRKETLLGPLSKTLDLNDNKTIASLTRQMASIFEGRRYLTTESTVVTPPGARMDVVIYTYLPPEESVGSFMLVSVIDVTEQRRMERELRASEERFRSVVEPSVDPIVILDADGNIVFWNEAAHRTFGYQSSEAIGRAAASFLPPDMVKQVQDAITNAKSGASGRRQVGPVEAIAKAKDGHHVPVEFTLATWVSERQTYYTVIIRDITEWKAAAERLKEQAKLLDIASDAIIVIDVDQQIRYWNKSAEALFGWNAEEVIGRTQDEILCSNDHSEEFKAAQEIAFSTGQWSGESHYSTKDGRVLTGDTRLTLVRDSSGKPTGILSVTSDTSARKALERELLRYQRLESIGTLAGGIAHDLNNVLTPIVSGVEALAMEAQDEKRRRILDIIKTSALRGASIIRQLLDFARGVESEQSTVEITHLLQDVRELILETFPKSIRPEIGWAPKLWRVRGESTQIHQVLMNLCVNARDAMPSGGTLTLWAENVTVDEEYANMHAEAKAGSYVVLQAADTGTGMGPDTVERIFDPFFTTKETGKGTGLGLSTALSIVRSHHGFITVDTEPDQGSTFRVYLPVVPGSYDPSPGEERTARAERGRGELIVVADDEVAVLHTTKQILESNGYRIATAVDGTDLLAVFVKHGADVRLVMTDMVMPHLDGPSAIRAIRKIDPKVPVITTSGLGTGRNSLSIRDLGVAASLAKPFTAVSLLETIRRVLDTPPSV